MSEQVMSADELLSFSEEQQEPISIELADGKYIKIKPLDLLSTLKISAKMRTDTPEGMAAYIANLIAITIVEPDLDDEQREMLKTQILSWPAPVVTRITDEYYRKMGVTDSALERAINAAEAFLAENQENKTQ